MIMSYTGKLRQRGTKFPQGHTHSKSGGHHNQAGPETELLATPPQHLRRNHGRCPEGKGSTRETHDVLAWGSLLCVPRG